MPLQKLVLKPGVNREGTSYANENGFFSCDKIRFRSGYAEKLGGWQNISPGYTYKGVARSLWAWDTLVGQNLIGIGTTQKFYVYSSGSYYDITPYNLTAPALSPSPQTIAIGDIDTDSAQPRLATITLSNHGLTPGTYITLSNVIGTLASDITDTTTPIPLVITTGFPTGAGPYTVQIDNEQITYTTVSSPNLDGTVTRGANSTLKASHKAGAFVVLKTTLSVGGVDLDGDFEVVSAPSSSTFTIALSSSATTASNASAVYLLSQIPAGGASVTSIFGWGAGGWGSGGWGGGSVSTTTIPARYWSQTNFDANLLFAPRYGAIYWWESTIPTFARAVTLASVANTQVKATTTATWLIAATSITVTDTTGINTGALVSGAGIPAGSYVGVSWDGSTSVPLVDISWTPAPTTAAGTGATVTFSYAGLHIPAKVLSVNTSSANAISIAFGAVAYDPFNFSDADNFDPLLVRWSDQDNPVEWVPETTNQAGEQRLSNGSYIVTELNTRQEILIWTDTALYSMQYLGPPYVFGINLLMDNLSIASSSAAITVNSVTYWMGVDKFYMYSGRVETLPCTLRQWIFGDINRGQLGQICCGTNEGFNEIWWFYPSADSQTNNRYVIYNHLEQLWYYGNINRTAWLDTQLQQYPLAAFSTQTSYLTTAMNATQTTITILDASTYPADGTVLIDSEKITYSGIVGNVLQNCQRGVSGTTAAAHSTLYVPVTVQTPNQLMYHEIGFDDFSTTTPTPIEAYVESADFDIGDGLNFAYVWRIIPDMTFDGSSAATPRCQLTVRVRQNSGSAYTDGGTDSQSVVRTSTYPVEQYTGQVYTRVRGRQMAFRMASTELGVFWQMGMMRIDLRQDGRR